MKNYTLWKVFSPNYANKARSSSVNNSGFTLIEAVTSLILGSLILGAAFSGFFSLRQLFLNDKSKTDINQRFRTIFGTIGPDIQQTGEGLIADPQFPAIIIEQTTLPNSDTTSEITIRKGSLIGFFNLCSPIAQGSTDTVNIIDENGSSACRGTDADNDGYPDRVSRWRGKRLEEGGQIKGYIYDSATGNNEFFDYTGEETLLSGSSFTPSPGNPPDEVNLTTNNYSWQNAYNSGTTVVYLIEERRYFVDNNRIQLIVNQGDTLNLIESIKKMDVTAYVQESLGGSIYECKVIPPTAAGDCSPGNPPNYSWAQIRSIELKVVAEPPEDATRNSVNTLTDDDLTLSQEFFPRNRLNF